MSVINGNQQIPKCLAASVAAHGNNKIVANKMIGLWNCALVVLLVVLVFPTANVNAREFRATEVETTKNSSLASLLLPATTVAAANPSAATSPDVVLANETTIAFTTGVYCEILLDDIKQFKEIGSVWESPQDPCLLHSCELNKNELPFEVIKQDTCGDFYCDIDSEVRPKNGTCCGECVQIKCRFEDQVFDIGKTWHNEQDCTLLECGQLPNGQPMINAYKRTCPALPKDCSPEHIYTEDCCQYCKDIKTVPKFRVEDVDSESEDIWTEEFYKKHPCVRECQMGEAPRTCHYNFVVEWYETLSKACYDCPRNQTDCQRPHCISGDGIARSITVINRMMPGPSIEVCQNDVIVVDVKNHLLGESTTIHWHGMHMKENPYMDGVPHITQCPISPHATFRYTFKAENSGTQFWHSHTGMQRGDGVFGALIVKRPRDVDPHGHLYDFDLSDHKMIVQDWVHVPGISMFASHHHSKGDNKPLNLLLNGKGRYYKAIWEQIKAAEKPLGRSGNGPDETTTKAPVVARVNKPKTVPTTARPSAPITENIADNDVSLLHPLDDPTLHNMRIQQNEISRTARLATQSNQRANNKTEAEKSEATTPLAASVELPEKHLTKRSVDPEIPLEVIPLHQYNVTRGFRYRFRIINAEFLNCPIQISIDNHTLTAINSDGYDFEAVDVGSIITYAGERFDFILNADQPIGNYWIRLKGLMDCDERFTSAFQVAILHYTSARDEEPPGVLGYEHEATGIELNAMNKGSGHVDSLTMAELNALPAYDSVPGLDRHSLKPVADYKFFVYYDFYRKDNPEFHPGDYYGMDANITNANRVFTPQLNHISLKFPSVALLPSRDSVDDALFCNETSLEQQGIDCRKEFCKCHHVLQVPLDSIVEFIIVDEGFTYDANHPFHLHGNAFRVVGMERLGSNVTVEMVKQLDSFNLLKRNLIRPPVKDTVTIPDGGYTIVRFEAYNPGFWLFHCHIEFHAEIGMALVLKVGDNDEMVPVPKNFPTCHDYIPKEDDKEEIPEEPEEPVYPVPPSPGKAAHGTHASYYVATGFAAMLMLLH